MESEDTNCWNRACRGCTHLCGWHLAQVHMKRALWKMPRYYINVSNLKGYSTGMSDTLCLLDYELVEGLEVN